MLKYSVPVLLVLFVACTKQEVVIPTDNTTTDSELAVYFDRFIEEGRSRGWDVPDDLNGITGSISDIGERDVIGLCYYNSATPNSIVIDREYWNSANDYGKEMVVFHELGHCFLDRDHYEGENSNGVCLSLMNSGTSGCYTQYNNNNRNWYLDELFGRVSS